MNDLIPSDPSQADPSIVALMAGIKSNESGGDYNKLGDKNSQGQYTAAGVGQWSNQVNGVPQPIQAGQVPLNFQGDAKQYGLDPSDFSPANQNKVMYAVLKDGKNKGLTPEQELSKWNSGDPNKYLTETTNQTGSVGTYNVAKYVDDGMKVAQQYAQKTKQPGSDYNPQPFSNPGAINTSGAAPTQSAPQQNAPITLGGIGEGALNVLNAAEKPFIGLGAAPFQLLAKGLGQKDPYQQGLLGGQAPAQVDPLASTAGGIAEQEAGNAAQVGSYFVPGGEGLIPTIAGGAAMGALQGAGSAASAGKNLTDVATQGAEGATVGGGTAGLLSGAGGLLGKAGESLTGEGSQKAMQGLKDAYTSALNLNASERGMETATGKDLAQTLVDNRVPLGRNDANGTLDASEAIPQLQSKLSGLNNQADPLVAAADTKGDLISLPQILDQTKEDIQSMGLSASDTKAKLASAEQQMKDEIDLHGTHVLPSVAEDIKQGLQATAFKKGRIPSDEALTQSDIAYALSKRMRSNLEDVIGSTDKGSQYSEINAQRSQLVDAIKRLTKLDGTRVVKGGRLGNMAGSLTGTIIGGSTGNPLAALAGDYFGGKAAEFLNNPATKIGIAGAKADAAKATEGLLGKAGKPVGKTLSGAGGAFKKSARPAGLLGNLVLNSQNKS